MNESFLDERSSIKIWLPIVCMCFLGFLVSFPFIKINPTRKCFGEYRSDEQGNTSFHFAIPQKDFVDIELEETVIVCLNGSENSLSLQCECEVSSMKYLKNPVDGSEYLQLNVIPLVPNEKEGLKRFENFQNCNLWTTLRMQETSLIKLIFNTKKHD